MSELLALQTDIAAALRDADAADAALQHLAGDAALATRRLAIYRANVGAAIAKALAAAYPIVRQIVGDEFFDGLAREFHAVTPSTSGDLTEYGVGFDAFLQAFPHVQPMPYLPDLARLEWAAHLAYGARDANPWDPGALASIEPERQALIRFDWAPGTAIVDSPYPLARLWAIHQPGFDGEFSVDWSIAECALVARNGLRVEVDALGAADAAFVGASLGGATLGAATDAALGIEPGFDLGRLLARAIAARWVCGFTLTEAPGAR